MPEESVAKAVVAQRELFSLVRSGAGEEAIRNKLQEVLGAQASPGATVETIAETAAQEALRIQHPWFRFFLEYDPRPALRQVQVPVLALCGEKDLQVEPEQNLPEIEQALLQGGNPDFTVEMMPGLNHLFQQAETGSPLEYYNIEETLNPAALQKISSWILERFG
jgi:pimeloyl-ACP methyl ester carboxylesterase